MCELAYKELATGKVGGKKITQYANAFKVASEAETGQVFDVVNEKDGEFWEWKSMVRNLNGPTQTVSTPASAATSVPRSGTSSAYATADERAKTQVYIVKQSSLAQAVNLLTTGAKVPPSSELILDQAQVFANWVLGTSSSGSEPKALSLADMPNDSFEVE